MGISAFSPLCLSVSRAIWKSISDRRAAAALGARPIPVVQGKWIGNLDILKHLKETLEVGYLGMYILTFVIKGLTMSFE